MRKVFFLVLVSFGFFFGCGGPSEKGCLPQEKRCKDSRVEICSKDGVWTTLQQCPKGCKDAACIDGECVPKCEGRECGDDGCGGSCGTCSGGKVCTSEGKCEFPPPLCGNGKCDPDEGCSNCPSDCGKCCGNGTCEPKYNENCDSCAADCGCKDDEVCFKQACCKPNCQDKECGDDGCGGSCGTCPGGEKCTPEGKCEPEKLNIYFGDLHAHTGYSDGQETPEKAFQTAKEQGLDFFITTDHDFGLCYGCNSVICKTSQRYNKTRSMADSANQPGNFVAIAGYEVTNWNWGHMNVFGANELLCLPVDVSLSSVYETYLPQLTGNFTVAFNHPNEGLNFNNFTYSAQGDKFMNSYEVFTPFGNFFEYYSVALSKRWHIGAIGTSDHHGTGWGQGHWTAVLAKNLTRADIIEGIKNHRTYATQDKDILLYFWINGHTLGESFSASGDIKVKVFVEDQGEVIDELLFYEDGAPVQTSNPNLSSYEWEFNWSLEKGNHYYFIRVLEQDGDIVVSSPIWVNSQ